MVGRGTRIHEETQKYKFWLYDYTDVTSLFGTDFLTKPPRPGGGGKGGGGDDGGGGGGGNGEGPHVAEVGGQYLRALFIALPKAQTVDDYAALLPWRIDLSAV